ncbi:MAG TPA: M48 family metallopeptidase [Terriglobia bacterium]|nr:M48 family metallopeptidase [Terriglobia bacterium]
MRSFYLVFALVFVMCPALLVQAVPASSSSSGGQQPSGSPSAATTQSPTTQPATQSKVTSYTLSHELYQKAHNLGRIRFRFRLISFVYGLIVLWLILHWKLAPRYRDWAEKFSSRRLLQSVVFSPLLLLTMAVLTLPADLYQHWISREYGLSVQGWGSWSWDWVKGGLISMVIGIILIWLLYTVIRRSAKRWWFYFWLFSLPILLFVLFISPWILDPMFHKFEPLQQKDPVLTESLERMVRRAGENIPPQRMFWMGAGEKTTTLNAYVTGFGASKRIVVWDTTIAKMNTPQIVFVTGHEMGHYVLKHIPKLLTFFAALFFVLFYLGFRSIGWVLSRWGEKWKVRGLDDWASLPALLFLLSVFVFLASPLTSAVSRHYEHQADQYGLEVTHGLTPDSAQVAAQAFQILGEVNLSDPEPNPVNVFLFYSHPPVPDRIQFCLAYDPWSKGRQGEFVK